MAGPKCNIVVIGVSCFDGMAGSMRVRNLLEPLVAKDEISLYNLIYEKDNKEPIGKEGTLNKIGFKIIGFRLLNILSVWRFFAGGMSFLKASRKKDSKNVLYVYNSPDIKCIFFIWYARMKGYKVLFDIIEDNSVEAHVGFMNKMRIKSSVFLFKRSRFFADGIVGISAHLYKLSQQVSKNKIPVYLIPITVNLNYFKNPGAITEKNKVQVFYGGSFAKKDGLEYLIGAFDKVCNIYPNMELILTGKGHPQDMEKINSRIDAAANKSKILFKGFLSTEAYYTLLNECDIFCMTRVNSKFANAGFPFKLGEFLASGKAVIATSVGDVPNYLTNGVNALLINPDAEDELTVALQQLTEDPAKRMALGKEARKTAEQYFDSDVIGAQLLQIFETI